GFVDEVGEVSAGESRCAAGNHRDVDIFAERNLACVDLQDAFTSTNVRSGYDDPTIKSSGPQQCGIENVRTVCRGDQDHAVVRFEAVHFDEQLVQRLFAFVMSAAKTGATMTTHSVDLVDEDDARS